MITVKKKQLGKDLTTLLMDLPAHVFWLDCDHRLLGCNLLQATSLGFSDPNEIIGKYLGEFLPPEDTEKLITNNELVMREKKTIVLEEPAHYPGQNSSVYLSSKSPLFDENGEVIGVLGIAQDVSKVKEQQALLLQKIVEQMTTHRDSEISMKALAMEITGDASDAPGGSAVDYLLKVRSYYENIIALMPGHVYWVNKEGRILGCNDRLAQSFGFQCHHDILGKTCHDLLSKSDADLLLQINKDVMNNRVGVTTEESVTMPQGLKRTYFSTKTPLFSENGEVIGILGTSLDITDRKIIEDQLIESRRQAEVANQAKTEFLMNMSHDLRTPFSGILGLSQLLYDGEQDPEKKEKLGNVVASGKQLLNLLNEIIDFTRVETGEFKINESRVDLPQLINEVLGLFAAEVQRKNLSITVNYPEDLSTLFITDRVMLHRILLNLISNAVKFTREGCITVNVKQVDDSETIALAIQDTGIGIPKDDLERIFEKFSRATLAHEGFYQGTGLGLSLVQRMVSCLQGDVTVESELRFGSTFTCYLPLEVVHEGNYQRVGDPVESTLTIDSDIEPILKKIQRQNPRVLVVEDDNISQRVAQYLLEAFNCEVNLTNTAAQALAQDIAYYDLVLIDIGLPDLSGVDVARAMRARFADISSKLDHPVYLVALTAYVDASLYSRYCSSGFDEVLRKPLTRRWENEGV